MNAERMLIAVLASALVAVALLSFGGGKAPAPTPVAGGGPADFSQVVERAIPSLVDVVNEGLTAHPAISGLGMVGEIPQESEGSGFFIDKEGLILTNYHVVSGAQSLKVITWQKKSYDAELVGADVLTDIALIRIKPDFPVTPAVLGDSDKVKVGQWVLAIGNPLGLRFLTSAGIVSGFGPPGRDYTGFFDFIQTDASVEPGNSGGPLLDTSGRVVGINNAYMGPGTRIGFAIPVNRAREVIDQLRRGIKISRGFLGVTGQPLTPGLAERLGVKDGSGTLINDVLEDSPARKGGLREGDVVIGFNGKRVRDFRDLQEDIYGSPAGATVKMSVVRNKSVVSLELKLGELMAHTLASERITRQCGMTLRDLSKEIADKLGIEGGGLLVLKVVPGCPAYEGGLRFGDVITKVEDVQVGSVTEFYNVYSRIQGGSLVLMEVVRNGRPLFVTIRQGAG